MIALHALGFTPLVLLGAGLLFLLVALSYAEATSALPETGGAATFVRRSMNDFAGFMTGWALFLDYLIVIALSALFVPHYLGAAFQVDALEHHPWDVVVAICAILAIAGVRLLRRPSLYAVGFAVPVLDLIVQLLLVVCGFIFLFSPDALTRGTSLGTSPTGRSLLFAAIGTVVTIYVAIAVVAVSAFPGPDTALGHRWLRAPLVGVAEQLRGHVPVWFADTIRFFVGASGALILLTAITTSISGFSRLAYSLGEHGQLPRAFGRLHRRTLVSPQAILAAALITCGIVAATTVTHHDVTFLASVYSFGVLIAFTAAQVAVIKLRITAPDLPRPYRAPLNFRFRGAEIPVPAVVGSVLTFAIWIVALATHPGARYAGPAWLLGGLVVYVSVRLSHGEGLTERVISPDEQVFEDVPHFRRILVPMKIGIIGEEMAATAIKLASEHGAAVEALHVIEVPLDRPLDAPMDDAEERAAASIAEAKLLGNELGVEVIGTILRARKIGSAIVEHARETDTDLIVLGSSPRWRRQSRFFSPTVDYVLRRAPCEVLIVAFPQQVLDEELAAT